MKLNVGDYVRTKWGIARLTDICTYPCNPFKDEIEEGDATLTVYYIDTCFMPIDETRIWKEDIIKSSPNIIDLIEENDLLKIEYFSLRYNERVTRLFEVDYMDAKFMCIKNSYCDFMLVNKEFNEDDKKLNPIIKSVLTHEQFEAMQYVVGEE